MIGNNLLFKPDVFHPERFMEALKLHYNITGVWGNLHHTGCITLIEGRNSNDYPETQAHVLERCTRNRASRISRHDSIIGAVLDKIRNNCIQVCHEQSFKISEDHQLRPDLVAILGDVAYIIDITM